MMMEKNRAKRKMEESKKMKENQMKKRREENICLFNKRVSVEEFRAE